MNKILFALLFASVSFSAIPEASAGKRVQKKTEDNKVVGVQKKSTTQEANKSSANPFDGFQLKRKRIPTEKVRENMIPLKRSYWDAVVAMEKDSKKLDHHHTTTN